VLGVDIGCIEVFEMSLAEYD